jgi:hypothetical protein
MDRLLRLRARKPVIHGAVEMESQLLRLSGSNERSHGHQAAVARAQRRPTPEIGEQYVVGGLRELRHHGGDALGDDTPARRLGLRVEFERRPPGVHRHLDALLLEDRVHLADCGNRVGPSGVEGEMGGDLADLGRSQTVLQPAARVAVDRSDLPHGDEGGKNHEAAVAGRKRIA